ncbi:hypothetical protein [Tunicatimonas pelagia]|uniref:hypothetical protein n=1 Tax=Tunicatimonas pelagia TaxID=931531 RepID=UPI0026655B88|nr:hypothetical protein [Tunicatimonas pelagia]WKN45506.1 hypothetical protein P0M28_11115 [Tunicatimonas pelagia]
MNAEQILTQLHDLANPTYLSKLQRFGIPTDRALGIRMPVLRLAEPYRTVLSVILLSTCVYLIISSFIVVSLEL